MRAEFRRHYDIVSVSFVALLLISNVSATKLVVLGGLIFDGGALLFPLTYVLGDVLAEVYGLRPTRRVIWLGFAASALMSATFLLVSLAPRPGGRTRTPGRRCWGSCPDRGRQPARVSRRAAVERTRPRADQGRDGRPATVGETYRLVGGRAGADTAVFCMVAVRARGGGPGGSIGWAALVNYIAVGWAYKVAVEAALLPLTYRVISWVRPG